MPRRVFSFIHFWIVLVNSAISFGPRFLAGTRHLAETVLQENRRLVGEKLAFRADEEHFGIVGLEPGSARCPAHAQFFLPRSFAASDRQPVAPREGSHRGKGGRAVCCEKARAEKRVVISKG